MGLIMDPEGWRLRPYTDGAEIHFMSDPDFRGARRSLCGLSVELMPRVMVRDGQWVNEGERSIKLCRGCSTMLRAGRLNSDGDLA